MQRPIIPLVVFLTIALAGCATSRRPTTATTLEPTIKAKIDKGIIEPGFTPEMVFLALGKPTSPKDGLADATQNGTWVYEDFTRNDRDFIKAGFRRRVVFDPVKRTDTIITEPVDPRVLSGLRAHSLHVTFRDGRVVEIQRVAEI